MCLVIVQSGFIGTASGSCYFTGAVISLLYSMQCDLLISQYRLSICNAVHCGAHGWCRRLKVVPLYSQDSTSYLLLQTLSLQDVSSNFRVWISGRQHGHMTMAIPDADFWWFGSAAIPYIVRSTYSWPSYLQLYFLLITHTQTHARLMET